MISVTWGLLETSSSSDPTSIPTWSAFYILRKVTPLNVFIEAFLKAMELLVSFDSELYGVIFLSVRVSLTAVLIASFIAIPTSIAIALGEFWGKSFVINVINTFMSLPPVVVGLIVYIMFSNSTGLFPDIRLLYTTTAMIIAQVLLAIPIISGLTIVAVRGVDKHIRNTAISIGVTPFQLVLLIVREARYAISAAVLAGFGRLMAEVGAVMMVGGNIRYQTRVMTTSIALQKSMGEFQQALALGMILLMVSFLVTAIVDMIRNGREMAH